MMVGTYDVWTPAEQREWDKDLEEMWTKHEQTEREMLMELQPVAKMMRHSPGKTTFLASNRSWSQVCKM